MDRPHVHRKEPFDLEGLKKRYRPFGDLYKPGQKAPYSGTFVCDRGTMLPPARVQLAKGEEFPEAEGMGAHTRWHGTDAQA